MGSMGWAKKQVVGVEGADGAPDRSGSQGKVDGSGVGSPSPRQGSG